MPNEVITQHVAVLSVNFKHFLVWLHENQKENEQYYYVSKIEDVRGTTFSRMEKTACWYEIPNAGEVEKKCLEQVR